MIKVPKQILTNWILPNWWFQYAAVELIFFQVLGVINSCTVGTIQTIYIIYLKGQMRKRLNSQTIRKAKTNISLASTGSIKTYSHDSEILVQTLHQSQGKLNKSQQNPVPSPIPNQGRRNSGAIHNSSSCTKKVDEITLKQKRLRSFHRVHCELFGKVRKVVGYMMVKQQYGTQSCIGYWSSSTCFTYDFRCLSPTVRGGKKDRLGWLVQ